MFVVRYRNWNRGDIVFAYETKDEARHSVSRLKGMGFQPALEEADGLLHFDASAVNDFELFHNGNDWGDELLDAAD